MEWLEGPTLASRLASQELTVCETRTPSASRRRSRTHTGSASSIATSSQPICCSSEGESTTSRSSISVLLATSSTRARSRARARSWEHRDTWHRSRPSESGPSIHVRTFSRSDVLFRCLAGRSAFDAADVLAILLRTVLEEAPRLVGHMGPIPERLRDLVLRMLSVPSVAPRDAAAPSRAAAIAMVGDATAGETVPPSSSRTRSPRPNAVSFPCC